MLSDDIDRILALQGAGWLARRSFQATSTLSSVKHHTADNGVELIDIESIFIGAAHGFTETHVLDWQEREENNHILGPTINKCRRIRINQLSEQYLRERWSEDVQRYGILNVYIKSDTAKTGKNWISEQVSQYLFSLPQSHCHQVWGVEAINGTKRLTRRILFTGNRGERITARVVYDYCESSSNPYSPCLMYFIVGAV